MLVIPVTWDPEAGGLQMQDQPGQHSETLFERGGGEAQEYNAP